MSLKFRCACRTFEKEANGNNLHYTEIICMKLHETENDIFDYNNFATTRK